MSSDIDKTIFFPSPFSSAGYEPSSAVGAFYQARVAVQFPTILRTWIDLRTLFQQELSLFPSCFINDRFTKILVTVLLFRRNKSLCLVDFTCHSFVIDHRSDVQLVRKYPPYWFCQVILTKPILNKVSLCKSNSTI